MNIYVVNCTNPIRCVGKYVIKARNNFEAGSRASDYLVEKYGVKPNEVLMYNVAWAEEIP